MNGPVHSLRLLIHFQEPWWIPHKLFRWTLYRIMHDPQRRGEAQDLRRPFIYPYMASYGPSLKGVIARSEEEAKRASLAVNAQTSANSSDTVTLHG